MIQSLSETELGKGAIHREAQVAVKSEVVVSAEPMRVASGEERLVSDLDLLRSSPALSPTEVSGILDDMLHLAGRSLTSFATDFVIQTNEIMLDKPSGKWIKTTEAIWRVSQTQDPSRQLSILLGVIEASDQGGPDKRHACSKLAIFGSRRYRQRMDDYIGKAISALADPSTTLEKGEAVEAVAYLKRLAQFFPSPEVESRLASFEAAVEEYRRRALVDPTSRSSGQSQKDFLLAGVASVAEAKFSSETRRLLSYFDDMCVFFGVIEKHISVDCMQTGVERQSHEMFSLHEDLIARAAGVLSSFEAREGELTREVGHFLDRAGSSLRMDSVRFVMNLNGRSASALYASALKARERGVLNTSEKLLRSEQNLADLRTRFSELERKVADEAGNRAVTEWGNGSGDPFDALSLRLKSRIGMDEDAISRFPFSPLVERRFTLLRRVEGSTTTWSMPSTAKGSGRVFIYASRDGREKRNTVLFPISGAGACFDLARIGSDLVLSSIDSPWHSYSLPGIVEMLKPLLRELDAYDFKFLVFNATFTLESTAVMSAVLRPGMQHTTTETGLVVVREDLDMDSATVGYASGNQRFLKAMIHDGSASDAAAPHRDDAGDEDGDDGDHEAVPV